MQLLFLSKLFKLTSHNPTILFSIFFFHPKEQQTIFISVIFTFRFAKTHTTDDYKNIVNEELHERTKEEKHITNSLDKDVQMQLWKHKYNFSASMKIINSVNKSCSQINKDNNPAVNVMGEKIDVISSDVEKATITESSSTAPPGEKNVSEECTPTEHPKETEGVAELSEAEPVVVTPERTSAAETIGADCLLPASARDKKTVSTKFYKRKFVRMYVSVILLRNAQNNIVFSHTKRVSLLHYCHTDFL